ncbi:Ribosome-binding factor [Trichinella spiralis]|uniref:Ribosome-binding factor n=1 Tax=Trichinella spiralis TaxID=6334 RepID=A0ABR3KF49_TRISP
MNQSFHSFRLTNIPSKQINASHLLVNGIIIVMMQHREAGCFVFCLKKVTHDLSKAALVTTSFDYHPYMALS